MINSAYVESTTSRLPARLAKTDLKLLAVFMAVVDAGGFSAAQVTLNIDQSTISRQMANLETRLGIRLCQRGRVGFRLTDKGRSVYASCQTLFRALEAFRGEVGVLRGHLVGELSIAVVDNWVTDATSPLPRALAELKAKGPGVQIDIHTVAPDEVELAVLDSRVNLGIGVFHQRRPGLQYELLYRDPLELYCARGHPLFDRADHATEEGLAEVDYVRRGYLAEERVAPRAARLPSSATAHQMEGVAFMILSGHYVGYLPVPYASNWVKDDLMRSLGAPTFRLDTAIEIVTRRGVTLSLVTRTFLEFLRDGAGADEGGPEAEHRSPPDRHKKS